MIPLGFSYSGELGGIHIGDPVYFKRDGRKILVTQGNISGHPDDDYQHFFEKNVADADGFHVITKYGQPVTDHSIADYISGLLCQNLKNCREQSYKTLLASEKK